MIDGIASETWKWTQNSRQAEDGLSALLDSIRTDHSRYTDGYWHALGVFLELPYWRRVWITQELAVTNYQALIAWVGEICELRDLSKAYLGVGGTRLH